VVEYRKAFAAVRNDPNWKRKIAVGALIALIPYVGMVWLWGWQMQYQRRVAWGDDTHISGWADFRGQALLGLKILVAILPYSLALSVVMTPPLMAGIFRFGAAAPSDPASSSLALAGGMAVWFIVFMGLTILLIPLTSSVMLRVALFGTIESGFQLKEIWRLMRENKTDLRRAWGFSTLNIGISYAAMITFFAFIGLVMALVPGSDAVKVIAVIVLGIVAYFAYMFFGTALSIYLGLVNMHLFGSYGRAAYGLQEAPRPVVPLQATSTGSGSAAGSADDV